MRVNDLYLLLMLEFKSARSATVVRIKFDSQNLTKTLPFELKIYPARAKYLFKIITIRVNFELEREDFLSDSDLSNFMWTTVALRADLNSSINSNNIFKWSIILKYFCFYRVSYLNLNRTKYSVFKNSILI